MGKMVYFEDLSVGASWASAEHTVDHEEMLAYNRANDPWPIHVDPDTAAKSPFGGLIANRGYGPARTVGRLFAFTPSYLYARPAVPGSDNRS